MKVLQDHESRALLNASRIGRLGCIDSGWPYVVPINYLFDDETIYSHSMPGRKIEALRAQPRVCLQVDEIESDFRWRSVIAYGRFEEVRVPDERKSILSKLLARFPLLTPVESVMARDAAPPDSIVFRIKVGRISGVEEE
jgi:nitroimidazol reductase NimA-like FMN-containing flavoprotein (pyridoxamine 5'-phosphate oxidase superfamily)